MSVGTAFNSGNVLGVYNNLRTQNKSNVNFNLEYSKRSLSSQLSLNFDDHDKLSFDNSYVNYEKGIANLSIGKVDRIWSFSEKSSLILSSNSRPLEALSLKLENRFNTNGCLQQQIGQLNLLMALLKTHTMVRIQCYLAQEL